MTGGRMTQNLCLSVNKPQCKVSFLSRNLTNSVDESTSKSYHSAFSIHGLQLKYELFSSFIFILECVPWRGHLDVHSLEYKQSSHSTKCNS